MTRPRELDDEAWLRSRYVDELMSVREIAELAGCGSRAVRTALTRASIRTRSRSEANRALNERSQTNDPASRRLHDADWLRTMYVDRGLSTVAIARVLERHPSVVTRALRRAEVPVLSTLQARRRRAGMSEQAASSLDDASWLREAYVDQRRSTGDIALELGVADRTVGDALRRHGIPVRSMRSAMRVHSRAAANGYDVQRNKRLVSLAKDAGEVGRAYTQVVALLGRLGRVPYTGREAGRLEREAMDGLYRAQDALAQRLLLGTDE